MKKIIFILLFNIICIHSQGQENYNYSFDSFTSYTRIIYGNTFKKKNYVSVRNSANPELFLEIDNKLKIARLIDGVNNKIFSFSFENRIEKTSDLKQLDTAIYLKSYKVCNCKNDCEELMSFEYEKDSINNQFIAHRILYKNKKKTKIEHEDYYIFKLTPDNLKLEKELWNEYFGEKHDYFLLNKEGIEKTICVEDDKKIAEIENIKTKTEQIALKFVANQ